MACTQALCEGGSLRLLRGCAFGCANFGRCTETVRNDDFDANGQLDRCALDAATGAHFSIDCGEVALGIAADQAYKNQYTDSSCTTLASSRPLYCEYADGQVCESVLTTASGCNETTFGGAPLAECTECCDRTTCKTIRTGQCTEGDCDTFGEVCAVGSCRAYFDAYRGTDFASTTCGAVPIPLILGIAIATMGGLALLAGLGLFIRQRLRSRKRSAEGPDEEDGPVIGSGLKPARDAKGATITRGWVADPSLVSQSSTTAAA